MPLNVAYHSQTVKLVVGAMAELIHTWLKDPFFLNWDSFHAKLDSQPQGMESQEKEIQKD